MESVTDAPTDSPVRLTTGEVVDGCPSTQLVVGAMAHAG